MAEIKPLEKPDFFVIVRLLERLWRAHEPMLKTHLQRAGNVNWDIFTKYLTWLHSRGLVTLEKSADGHERVKITRKGWDAYRRLVEWVNEYVHGLGPGIV